MKLNVKLSLYYRVMEETGKMGEIENVAKTQKVVK